MVCVCVRGVGQGVRSRRGRLLGTVGTEIERHHAKHVWGRARVENRQASSKPCSVAAA